MKIEFNVSAIFVILAVFLSERGEMIVLFFASALFHEIGHLLAAKILKKRVDRIEIGFSGARIVMRDTLLSYKDEFIIAAMGPVFNILMFGIIVTWFACARSIPSEVILNGLEFLENGGREPIKILGFCAVSAIAQAFLNLLPVKSLDGGRMLYCFFASFFGERAGERAIGIATSAVAFFAWTVALYLMLKTSAGLAVFVFAVWAFFKVRGNSED